MTGSLGRGAREDPTFPPPLDERASASLQGAVGRDNGAGSCVLRRGPGFLRGGMRARPIRTDPVRRWTGEPRVGDPPRLSEFLKGGSCASASRSHAVVFDISLDSGVVGREGGRLGTTDPIDLPSVSWMVPR